MTTALIDEIIATGCVFDLALPLPLTADDRLQSRQVGFLLDGNEERGNLATSLAERFLTTSGLGREVEERLGIALREMLQNAYRHGNGGDPTRRIALHLMRDDEKVVVTVADTGEGFDFPDVVQQTLARGVIGQALHRARQGNIGGLGIRMMLECADRVLYDRAGGGYLVKYYRPPSEEEMAKYQALQPLEIPKEPA